MVNQARIPAPMIGAALIRFALDVVDLLRRAEPAALTSRLSWLITSQEIHRPHNSCRITGGQSSSELPITPTFISTGTRMVGRSSERYLVRLEDNISTMRSPFWIRAGLITLRLPLPQWPWRISLHGGG